jgi:hypothetical protein
VADAAATIGWRINNEYIGCYQRAAMAGTTAYLAGDGVPMSSNTCRSYCASYKLPIYMLDSSSKCMCGAFVPNIAQKDSDTPCTNSKATHLVVYYKYGSE